MNTALPAAEREPLPPSLRVLIVEDVHDEAEMLRALLLSWGLSPWVTHRATSALALVDSHRPHVVLLDLGLRDLHGFEVARQVRRRRGIAPIMIAVTGWGQEADRAQGRAAGIDHHLVKPVDASLLYDLLAASSNEALG